MLRIIAITSVSYVVFLIPSSYLSEGFGISFWLIFVFAPMTIAMVALGFTNLISAIIGLFIRVPEREGGARRLHGDLIFFAQFLLLG